jgi:hypothetical protein
MDCMHTRAVCPARGLYLVWGCESVCVCVSEHIFQRSGNVSGGVLAALRGRIRSRQASTDTPPRSVTGSIDLTNVIGGKDG